MDPVPPTTHVHHPYHGDLVVVATPGMPNAEERAAMMERVYGPGTWCIFLAAHERALNNMDLEGESQVSGDDFRWVPWNQLRRKET